MLVTVCYLTVAYKAATGLCDAIERHKCNGSKQPAKNHQSCFALRKLQKHTMNEANGSVTVFSLFCR